MLDLIIENEEVILEINECKASIEELSSAIFEAEDVSLSIEEAIVAEKDLLNSNEEITQDHINMSLISTNGLFGRVGYNYDSSLISSTEDYREALKISVEAKILSLKDIGSMVKAVYDKIVIFIKKLYVKVAVYMNNAEKVALALKDKLATNRAKASSDIKIDDKLEDVIISKFGSYMWGFSNGSIDTKFTDKLFEDLRSFKVMGEHREIVYKIINNLLSVQNTLGIGLISEISPEHRKILKEAFEIKEDVISTPFKYNGLNYKCLKLEKFDLSKYLDRTYADLFAHMAGMRVLVDIKKIDPKEMKGKFKSAKYDDLDKILDKVISESKTLKSFQGEMDKESKAVLKTINDINLSPNKSEQAVMRALLPSIRYSNIILSTIAVDKTIGFINGLKDMINLVNYISKVAIKEAGGANPIDGMALLPNLVGGETDK